MCVCVCICVSLCVCVRGYVCVYIRIFDELEENSRSVLWPIKTYRWHRLRGKLHSSRVCHFISILVVHPTMYNVHCTVYIMYSVQYTLCTMYSVQYTLCTVYSIQCALCTMYIMYIRRQHVGHWLLITVQYIQYM